MAKYKHLPDTFIVLRDIENRLVQLMEANTAFAKVEPELVEHQNQGLRSALIVVQQAIKTGHVFRGSSAVPDGLLEVVKTPSVAEKLGV